MILKEFKMKLFQKIFKLKKKKNLKSPSRFGCQYSSEVNQSEKRSRNTGKTEKIKINPEIQQKLMKELFLIANLINKLLSLFLQRVELMDLSILMKLDHVA